MDVLLLDHAPPDVALLNVIVDPVQRVPGPVIGVSDVTVMVFVIIQPAPVV